MHCSSRDAQIRRFIQRCQIFQLFVFWLLLLPLTPKLAWLYQTSGGVPQGFVSWPAMKPTLWLYQTCLSGLEEVMRWEEVAWAAWTAVLAGRVVPCPGSRRASPWLWERAVVAALEYKARWR